MDTDTSLIVNATLPIDNNGKVIETYQSNVDEWALLHSTGVTWPDAFPPHRHDGLWTIPQFKVAAQYEGLASEADDSDQFGDYLEMQGWDFDEADLSKVNYRGVDIAVNIAGRITTEFTATVAIVEMLGRIRELRQVQDSFFAWKMKNEPTALAAIHPTYPDANYIDSHNADNQTVKCVATGVKNYRLAISTRNKEPVFQPCDTIARADGINGIYVVTERAAEAHAIPIYDAIVALRETAPEAYATLLAIVVEMTAKKVADAAAKEAECTVVADQLAAMSMAELVAMSHDDKDETAKETIQ